MGRLGRSGAWLKRGPEWLRAYLIAVAALALGTLLAIALLRVIGPGATLVVSLLGDVVFLGCAWMGYGPGILASFLLTFAIPPLLVPGKPVHPDFGKLGLLLLISLLVSRVASSKRRTEALLVKWGDSLDARIRERTKALEDSERRYRLLFENNPQPMWVYDQETLAFLTVNDTAIQRYGYTREEFLGMTLKDIRPEEDIPKLMEATSVPTLDLHQEGPWRHRKKNGEVISVEITEDSLIFDEHPACLVMAIDITERLRLEEQYRQAQRLESIGRLAGGVAHDFNNLLTVINGFAEMLKEVPMDQDSAEAVDEIGKAGERAADLTRQLLAFSRRQMVQPAVININATVKSTEAFLRRLIGEDIEFVTRLDPELGAATVDPGQIQQIIMNLAVNSRDAMPDGGLLVLETANVMLDDAYCRTHSQVQPGAYVMLAVTDTGAGMTPEVQARIFEPFYTTKGLGQGTGLGLATVYGMVKSAGGWIWVYSEVGRGTTFKVYLPRTDMPLTPARPPIPDQVMGSETILVVEDQTEVRALAVKGLAHFGYDAHGVPSGAEALRFCREFQGEIHLVVTDVVMPDMNGREVARQIAALRSDARVLFMSGYTTNVIAHQGVLDSGVEYLQKPFTPEILARKVRELLDSVSDAGGPGLSG